MLPLMAAPMHLGTKNGLDGDSFVELFIRMKSEKKREPLHRASRSQRRRYAANNAIAANIYNQ
jgi:hypothetical protein